MSFMNNIKIGRKLALVFGVMVVIMVLSGAMTAWQVENANSAADNVARVRVMLANLNVMHEKAVGQSIEVRGLLLTGDRSTIDRFKANGAEFDTAADRLLTMMGAASPATKLVNAYVATNRAWRATAEKQIALMRKPLTVDEARAMEANGAGNDYIAELRDRYSALSKMADAVMDGSHAAEAQAFALVWVSTIVSAVLGIAVSVLGYLLLTSVIASPINAMTATMGAMADGRHDVTVPGVGRGDEVGAMAGAVEVFRRNMIENERLEAEAAAKQEAELKRAQTLRDVTASFETDAQSMTELVASAATELQRTAESLNGIAEHSQQRAVAVATASEQTSANVQTVATASTELSSSINEISRQVAAANDLASAARTEASSTQAEIQALADAAQKIGDVVNLIQEIAEQTNLLALNATIESARAGDAGKGFAVVASEVKNLAGQTGKATEEIAAQIQAVQDRTRSAVDAIAKIVDRVNEVQEVASNVAAAVEEQDSATREISRNVEEVAAAAENVTTNISGVRDSATQTGDSSREVLSTAGELSKQAEGLKARVGRFLGEVRAA